MGDAYHFVFGATACVVVSASVTRSSRGYLALKTFPSFLPCKLSAGSKGAGKNWMRTITDEIWF